MKKIVAFAVILVMAISLNAQFKTGMGFRTRSEMYCTDENVQVWKRVTDLRFRPYLSYTQNEYLSAKVLLEIGEIQFGNAANGGAMGTDGVNVETKNLYLSVTPDKNNQIILGLQPYKDFHSLILDWDVAGISWKNNYMLQGKKLTSYLGWFVSADDNEDYIGGTTYSFGSSEVVADFEYQINDKMKIGVNNLAQFVRMPSESYAIHRTELNLWSAPYFAGTFNEFYIEAVLAANNIRPEYEEILAVGEIYDAEGQAHYSPEHTGLVFSLKTKYTINKDAAARFNFMFRDADTEWIGGNDSFYGLHSYYTSGLEILTEAGFGMEKSSSSPISAFPVSTMPFVESGYAGIIMPSIFVDYDVTRYVKKMEFINELDLTLGMGHAVTAYEVYRVTGSDGQARPETWIGTELDFKAKIKMFDQLTALPYLAILFPGEWYDYDGGHKPFTKVGITLKTKIK